MHPPIFELASADGAVTAILGTTPTRLYPFGEAPQTTAPSYALPYAVWQDLFTLPENYVNEVPDIDRMSIQIDVYAESSDDAWDAGQVLRDLYQQHGTITAMRGHPKEPDTKLFRYQLDIDFWQDR